MPAEPSLSFVGLVASDDWTRVYIGILLQYSTRLMVTSPVVFHCLYAGKSSIAMLIVAHHVKFSSFSVQVGNMIIFERRFICWVGYPFFTMGPQNFQTARLYLSAPTLGGGIFHVS